MVYIATVLLLNAIGSPQSIHVHVYTSTVCLYNCMVIHTLHKSYTIPFHCHDGHILGGTKLVASQEAVLYTCSTQVSRYENQIQISASHKIYRAAAYNPVKCSLLPTIAHESILAKRWFYMWWYVMQKDTLSLETALFYNCYGYFWKLLNTSRKYIHIHRLLIL